MYLMTGYSVFKQQEPYGSEKTESLSHRREICPLIFRWVAFWEKGTLFFKKAFQFLESTLSVLLEVVLRDPDEFCDFLI